jgi:hypothetical protein
MSNGFFFNKAQKLQIWCQVKTAGGVDAQPPTVGNGKILRFPSGYLLLELHPCRARHLSVAKYKAQV